MKININRCQSSFSHLFPVSSFSSSSFISMHMQFLALSQGFMRLTDILELVPCSATLLGIIPGCLHVLPSASMIPVLLKKLQNPNGNPRVVDKCRVPAKCAGCRQNSPAERGVIAGWILVGGHSVKDNKLFRLCMYNYSISEPY